MVSKSQSFLDHIFPIQVSLGSKKSFGKWAKVHKPFSCSLMIGKIRSENVHLQFTLTALNNQSCKFHFFFYHLVYSDYCLHFYCYIHNFSAKHLSVFWILELISICSLMTSASPLHPNIYVQQNVNCNRASTK